MQQEIILRLIFIDLSHKQHFVALLSHKQQNSAILFIEQDADAWYYVITARETKQTKPKQRRKKKMITVLVVTGVGIVSAISLGGIALYLVAQS